MFKKIFAITATMSILSGCSSTLFNTDELMRPPQLSEEQASILSALESSLGSADISLKYPRYGDYRSAFVFEDITGDSIEECIIFYEGANSYTRIHVMENKNGLWQSVYDTIGLQADVEFVDFLPITDSSKNNMLIGWDSTNQYEEQKIVIYDYTQRDGEKVLDNVFDDDYSRYEIVSRKNSDSKELVLIASPKRNSSVRLIRGNASGGIIVIGVTYLNPQVADYVNLTLGNIDDEIPALFIDELLYNGMYATEIISLEHSKIDNLMVTGDDPNLLFDATQRYDQLYSVDLNGDGIVEIPSQKLMIGYEDASQDGVQYITRYNNLDRRSLVDVQSHYTNLTEGYTLKLPDSWIDTVTVKEQMESGEITFFEFNEDLDNSTTELLRIRTYGSNDYRDNFELEQFVEIASKGGNIYYVYIPTQDSNPLSITYDELTSLFSLI